MERALWEGQKDRHGSAVVQTHNREVAGSSPASATEDQQESPLDRGFSCVRAKFDDDNLGPHCGFVALELSELLVDF